MIPVYINSERYSGLQLDGECLVVQREGKAANSLPIRQVSRLVVIGVMDIPLAALLACARARIPVIFVDQEGQLVARLDSLTPSITPINSLIDEFMLLPDWHLRYQQWLMALERQAMVKGLRGQRLPLSYLRDVSGLRAHLNKALTPYAPTPQVLEVNRRLHVLLLALTQTEITQRGIGSRISPHVSKGIPLLQDFSRILRWHLESMVKGFLVTRYHWQRRNGRSALPITEKQVIKLFEENRGRLEQETRLLFERLHIWLSEQVRDEPV